MAYELATMDDFMLGEPALVCRWRLHNGHIPCLERHLAALKARRLGGAPLSPEVVAWVTSQLEPARLAAACPAEDAVLSLLVDAAGAASLTTAPYQPLPKTSLSVLAVRSAAAQAEAERTGVAPEALWVADGRGLAWDAEPTQVASGVAAQLEALARMNGLPVVRQPGLGAQVTHGIVRPRDAFLSSDEHGVVPAGDATGQRARGMAAAYQRALASARP